MTRRHMLPPFALAVALLAALAGLIVFQASHATPARSGSAPTVAVQVDDYWFCGPPYQGRVCDTHAEPGTLVVWDMAGAAIPHSVVECGASCDQPTNEPLWDSGIIDGGSFYMRTFEEPGVYLYYCDLHPTQMRGRIIVGDVTLPPAPTPAPPGPTPRPDDLYAVRGGLKIERFASGLKLPVNLALAAQPPARPQDTLLYVSELYDGVAAVSRNGTVSTYADGLLNYDPTVDFPGSGENGVNGIAIDAETGDLFVSLVGVVNGELENRVVRLLSSDDGLRAQGQQIVLAGIPSAPSHQIQAVSFGPDGKLYVNTGEAMRSAFAQDPNSLLGKVLRVNLNGTAPADNPTAGSAVFALGFRNPFGAAWSPDGRLYVTDNGPGPSGDRLVRVDPGGNYGWCCNVRQNALYMFARATGVGITALAFDSEHVLSPEGETHLFVAFSGPTYANGATARGKKILDLKLDAEGNVQEATELLHYAGHGFSTVVGLVIGPGGLYFTDLYGEGGFEAGPPSGNIYRVFDPALEATPTPTATETPPPSASPSPTSTATATPTRTPRANGDVDCDGRVTSIDATLILQLEAGLLASLRCPAGADLNADGLTNSVDAQLVLALVAGILRQ